MTRFSGDSLRGCGFELVRFECIKFMLLYRQFLELGVIAAGERVLCV